MSDSTVPLADSTVPLAGPARHLDTRVDTVFLALSIGTLMLACILQTRGPKDVVVPWLDFTLPDTCSMRRWAGIDCAGCGLTRSFIRTAHGDVIGGWNFHPVGPLLLALVVAQIPYRSWQIWRCRAGRERWRGGGYWIHLPLAAIITLMLTRWILRLCLGST